MIKQSTLDREIKQELTDKVRQKLMTHFTISMLRIIMGKHPTDADKAEALREIDAEALELAEEIVELITAAHITTA